MTNFNSFDLPSFLLDNVLEMGYEKPTKIQEEAIPVIMSGRDMLGSSQTGSGKTAAFSIPIVTKVASGDAAALILVPTRELAIQIKDVMVQLCKNQKFGIAVIFGGSDMRRQIDTLKRKPKIVIATPGRLQDHVERRTIDLSNFNTFVLDEFDRMLDMGFKDEIAKIAAKLPPERQTLMFSATTRKSVVLQAGKYLHDHVEIITQQEKAKHANIKQEFINVSGNTKYDNLTQELSKRQGLILVFANTKRTCDDLMNSLLDEGYACDVIHGDLRQRERERALSGFKKGITRILIATDVAARGIDVDGIELVLNYDLPKDFETYTHRIGRTGRGGADGLAISFFTNSEKKLHNNILMGINSDDAEPDTRGRGFAKTGQRKFTSERRFSGSSNPRTGDSRRRNDRGDRSSSASGYGGSRKKRN